MAITLPNRPAAPISPLSPPENTMFNFLHNLKNRLFPADSRWLDDRAIAALTRAVQEGERGHGGELRLVIERRPLPADTTAQSRAERHFATLGLWNTADRSGVLIYLNLAARKLHILADSGVSAVVPQNVWDDLAARTLRAFRVGHETAALENLVKEAATLLRQHFGKADDPHGNELPDHPVIIE